MVKTFALVVRELLIISENHRKRKIHTDVNFTFNDQLLRWNVGQTSFLLNNGIVVCVRRGESHSG